jgi:virulence factor Mce-like protein
VKRILISAVVLLGVGALLVFSLGASSGGSDPTYKVELDNAFGLVNGEQVKVAGVPAGTISNIGLDRKTLNAIVTVQVTNAGFGSFHTDASCESRPQSLIGEYFLNCDPGSSGPVLKPGGTIPVTQTQSTIPADLLQDIMQMPYRQRLTLIINELGAGVAGNSQNLQAALDRAVPALTETDSLLNLLANDSSTLQNLTSTSDSLVTALANNSASVQRFIVEANNAATDTATQNANLRGTFQNLPGFLEQLKPAMAKLGTAVTANDPVLNNLNASAGEIDRLLTVLPSFSNAARPAIKTLGQASVTGKAAVTAAKPTVKILNRFAKPTPELAQNLAIVLQSLDTQANAVEKDPRSPGGEGYSGLEALLQYVFNQTLDLDYLGPWGHVQAVDAFVNPSCSSYATPATVASNLKQDGSNYRSCYSWLGPTQPGVNSPDPSNPGACPPDPGGEPPYAPSGAHPIEDGCTSASSSSASKTTKQSATRSASKAAASGAATAPSSAGSTASGGGSSGGSSSSGSAPPIDLHKTIGSLLGALGGSSGSSSSSGSSQSGSTSTSTSPSNAQQLLNYLLSP